MKQYRLKRYARTLAKLKTDPARNLFAPALQLALEHLAATVAVITEGRARLTLATGVAETLDAIPSDVLPVLDGALKASAPGAGADDFERVTARISNLLRALVYCRSLPRNQAAAALALDVLDLLEPLLQIVTADGGALPDPMAGLEDDLARPVPSDMSDAVRRVVAQLDFSPEASARDAIGIARQWGIDPGANVDAMGLAIASALAATFAVLESSNIRVIDPTSKTGVTAGCMARSCAASLARLLDVEPDIAAGIATLAVANGATDADGLRLFATKVMALHCAPGTERTWADIERNADALARNPDGLAVARMAYLFDLMRA